MEQAKLRLLLQKFDFVPNMDEADNLKLFVLLLVAPNNCCRMEMYKPHQNACYIQHHRHPFLTIRKF